MLKPADRKHVFDAAKCVFCNNPFLARRDSVKKGMGKFCSKSCQVKDQHKNGTNKAARSKQNHHLWKGKIVVKNRYIFIHVLIPHPRAYRGMYVPEHILIAEKILNRYLDGTEVVHHIDENPSNNNPANLSVMTRSEHTRIHKRKIINKCIPLSCFILPAVP